MIEEFYLRQDTIEFIDFYEGEYDLCKEFQNFLNEKSIIIAINPWEYYYSCTMSWLPNHGYIYYKNQKIVLKMDKESLSILLDYKYKYPFVLDIPKQDILQVKTELLLTWS